MSKYLKDKTVYYTVDEHGIYDGPEHIRVKFKSIAVHFTDDAGKVRLFTTATTVENWQGDIIEVYGVLIRAGLLPHKTITVDQVPAVFEKYNITLIECEKEN